MEARGNGMTEDFPALESRVGRLEIAVIDGFKRIELLIQKEITDLKSEQLAQFQRTLDWTLDDQRAAWAAIRLLEQYSNQRRKVTQIVGGFLAVGFGGFVTWLATFLTAQHPHP